MPTPKPVADAVLAPITIPQLGGGEMTLSGPRGAWTLVVIYRGKHCPRCKKYLNILNDMLDDWTAAGFDVLVASADSADRAAADQAEFGWRFPLGYDLSEAQMGALGLYVTEPLSPQEAERNFAEPGTFVLRPDGSQLIVAISNGPAVRPEMGELLDGMIFNKTNDRPTRGTV